jgi:hypothetical protein
MSNKSIVVTALGLILGVLCRNALANTYSAIRIIVPRIDYHAQGVSGTRAFGINDFGNLSLEINYSSGDEKVVTVIDRHFSAATQPPGTDQLAAAGGINNLNVVVGYFYNGTSFDGFLLKGNVYSTFDVNVPGATFTAAYNLNDFGDISGSYGVPSTGNYQAYRMINGLTQNLNVENAVGTIGDGINDLRQVVGIFSTSDPTMTLPTCDCQGVLWDKSGKFVRTINVSNAMATEPISVNIAGWTVGRYWDSSGGGPHGFVYNLYSQKFIVYDYPNAAQTSLNGINDLGYIAGRYTDTSGTAHGFIARLRDCE